MFVSGNLSLHIEHIILSSCSSFKLSCFNSIVLSCSRSLGSLTFSKMLPLCYLTTCRSNSIAVLRILLHCLHFWLSCFVCLCFFSVTRKWPAYRPAFSRTQKGPSGPWPKIVCHWVQTKLQLTLSKNSVSRGANEAPINLEQK